MRVLDAALEAALNDNPNPYLQLQYCIDNSFTWTDAPYPLIAYKLGDLQLTVRTAGKTGFPWYAIRLKRGAVINNVPNYVTSSTYYVNETSVTEKEQLEIEATILPKGTTDKYSVNGNQSYITILDALCAHYGYTAVYEDDTADFWDNIMYPAGRTLVLQSPHSIFTLLRQKMFIYAMDNNDEEIYFRQWIDDSDIGTVTHPPLETIATFEWKKKYSLQKRMLLWRDESMVIHNYPNPAVYPDLPLYNLGYIESTASTPTQYQAWHASEDKRTWHLKYQDGDIIHCSSTTYQVQVFEVYEPKEHPRLYLQFKALTKFSSTEGGPLPSTIEAAAPYTPLNVSNFNGILDANDNNIQAAMESIDDHAHAYSALTGLPTIREVLAAARTYYVRTDGNDGNTGLANTAAGAFLTVQKAIDTVAALDISIYDVTIQIADGTYSTVVGNTLKQCTGSGQIFITGNTGTPANVVISTSGNNANVFYLGAVNTKYTLQGMKLSSSGTNPIALRAQNGGTLYFGSLNFGSGYYGHIVADQGGTICRMGNYTISASAGYHLIAQQLGKLIISGGVTTISGTPAFTAFLYLSDISEAYIPSMTYNGSATGQRYNIVTNSVCTSGTTLPGNAAGAVATGGQYI